MITHNDRLNLSIPLLALLTLLYFWWMHLKPRYCTDCFLQNTSGQLNILLCFSRTKPKPEALLVLMWPMSPLPSKTLKHAAVIHRWHNLWVSVSNVKTRTRGQVALIHHQREHTHPKALMKQNYPQVPINHTPVQHTLILLEAGCIHAHLVIGLYGYKRSPYFSR